MAEHHPAKYLLLMQENQASWFKNLTMFGARYGWCNFVDGKCFNIQRIIIDTEPEAWQWA